MKWDISPSIVRVRPRSGRKRHYRPVWAISQPRKCFDLEVPHHGIKIRHWTSLIHMKGDMSPSFVRVRPRSGKNGEIRGSRPTEADSRESFETESFRLESSTIWLGKHNAKIQLNPRCFEQERGDTRDFSLPKAFLDARFSRIVRNRNVSIGIIHNMVGDAPCKISTESEVF